MRSKPIPILLLSSRGDYGAGGERYLLNILRHIDRSRFAPQVVLPSEGTFRELIEKLDFKVDVVDMDFRWLGHNEKWYRSLDCLADSTEHIQSIIKSDGIKLVHTNSNLLFSGLLAAHLSGIHHIYAARVDFQPELPIFQKLSIDKDAFSRFMGDLSTKVLAVSETVAAHLSPPIPQQKIKVIYNGVEPGLFGKATENIGSSIRSELDLKDQILIVGAGRVSPDKGFDVLIEAASRIVPVNPHVHFAIAGDIEDKTFFTTLREKVDANGLSDNIHFLGFRDDMGRILHEADIFVLSSRREGQSNALLEAMASNCAVVATRCSGVTETVVEGKTGYIVDIDDAEGLAQPILELIADRAKILACAKAGLQRVHSHFLLEDKIMELMGLYDEVIALPPPVPGNPAVKLFLNGTRELSEIGLRVLDLERRIGNIEGVASKLKSNILARVIRRLVKMR